MDHLAQTSHSWRSVFFKPLRSLLRFFAACNPTPELTEINPDLRHLRAIQEQQQVLCCWYPETRELDLALTRWVCHSKALLSPFFQILYFVREDLVYHK